MQTIKIKDASTFFQKTIGLLGHKKAFPIRISTRFGIHTFGMQYPIDVLILDRENKVQKVKTNLKPWRFFFWNPRYTTVVELPKGTISKQQIKKGNTIQLQVA